jgi:hypothetical protein
VAVSLSTKSPIGSPGGPWCSSICGWISTSETN